MNDTSPQPSIPGRASLRWQATIVVLVAALVGGGELLLFNARPNSAIAREEASSAKPSRPVAFDPTAAQWAGLKVEPVAQRSFRAIVETDGKIAIDENRATPIFSPYAGRVTKIAVEPGEAIKRGQLLFALEATDMVQAQNDFIVAVAGLETARSQLHLAQINEQRQHSLYDAKAVPLKDWQQSQADLTAARDNLRSAEIALEAARNRLRILAKTEQEIADFEKTGRINPETPIYTPIDGTVVQRKLGPGQFITSGASDPAGDPVFVIGDLSTVWLVANVRESDALKVHVGQDLQFRVLSAADRIFAARINYVATALDTTTRRLLVRATVENAQTLLRPEMFASVRILTSDDQMSPAVPRDAVIYEGSAARVWVAPDENTIEVRQVATGVSDGNFVQVTRGLRAGEKVVVKGALFIDRAATGSES
jgi:cobalt-zinc-cadmium efflux system membrane fusion protein